jgi:hypothetical protein
MKTTKTETKVSKPKKQINVKKTVKKYIVRPTAFTVLFIFASYGVRHALSTLQDPMQIGLTIFTVSAIAYIILDTSD